MKLICNSILFVLLFLFAIQGKSAELLGKISDETEPLKNQEQAEASNKPKIVYRVICSPDGEKLPECEQAPVNDYVESTPTQTPDPETANIPAQSNTQQKPPETVEQIAPQDQPLKARAKKPVKHHKNKKPHKHSKHSSKRR